ncbi:MAG: hypothetical protein ACMG6E_06165 [Candidatus Roizmanbacteria bacterium]
MSLFYSHQRQMDEDDCDEGMSSSQKRMERNLDLNYSPAPSEPKLNANTLFAFQVPPPLHY